MKSPSQFGGKERPPMMKKNGGGLFFTSALISMFIAVPAAAIQEQAVTIRPQSPMIGDEIVITYDQGAKAANLRTAQDITAEVFIVREDDMPVLLELPMKNSGKLWKCSFKLSDNKARWLLVRFVSGELVDDNGENAWNLLVCGSNGQPLKGAYLQRAVGVGLQNGRIMDFRIAKDIAGAKADFLRERELYPGNWRAAFASWSMLMRDKPGDETKAEISRELEELYETQKNDEEAAAGLLSWFEQIGQREKAEKIRQAAIAANPKGPVAMLERRREVFAERDPKKGLELVDKFLADFPQQGQILDSLQMAKAQLLVNAGEFDKAAALLASMPKKDGNLYNSLAWGLIEKGEELERAVAWAKTGVELLRNPDPSTKPPYLSEARWKKSLESQLGYVLDTYAYGLAKMGKTAEAEKAYEEAYAFTKGAEAEINQRLVECYVKNGRYDKAMATALECVRKGQSSDQLIEQYKNAYVKTKGSEAGFDEVLNEAKNRARADLRKELMENLVSQPAIDFSLKALDGNFIKLSELRGKVVVLDFWATWCGPCKAAFPFLQQVYEKYKPNPDVVILALNTWESEQGAEREALVRNFMEENKYTFRVLFDDNVVSKYGVDGIPTRFVIDKKGMIQFKSVGFEGSRMLDEMTVQIDMLLDDSFYSSVK
jgi:thiol-disulfide isomerase/thioredoxin